MQGTQNELLKLELGKDARPDDADELIEEYQKVDAAYRAAAEDRRRLAMPKAPA